MTSDELIVSATSVLANLPRLHARLPEEAIRRSVEATFPDPPAPLIYWLWIASTDYLARHAARESLASLEQALAILDDGRFVRGPWRRRVKRLLPTQRKATYEDFSNFRSTFYELVACFRLLNNSARVILGPEGTTTAYDLTVEESGTSLVGIELYGPQKGVREMYEREIAVPWSRLLRGEDPYQSDPVEPSRFSFAGDAVATAVSNILTDGNFKVQKAKQLALGPLPTL